MKYLQLLNMGIKHTSILLFYIFVVSACQNANQKTDLKASNELRIVSLAPSVTKELSYLGVEDKIVGATSFCNLSKGHKELIVGNVIDINIEKILLLKPTVVIATDLTKQNNIDVLKNNGIKVYKLGKMKTFQDICDEFITMGKMVGREDTARVIIDVAVRKIDSMRNNIAQQKKKKVFFQIGAKPLFAVIPDTFMDDLIRYANCENLAYDLKAGTMTRESVIARNPDVIYVATMGIIGGSEKKVWESYHSIQAVKNKKVFIIDSGLACTPSVISFTQTLSQMIKEIYSKEN